MAPFAFQLLDLVWTKTLARRDPKARLQLPGNPPPENRMPAGPASSHDGPVEHIK